MKRSKNTSNGTKGISFLSNAYKKITFWLRWPFVCLVVLFRRVIGDAEKAKTFNVKWPNLDKMPVHNWIKICETGDLNWLFVTEGIVSSRVEDHWMSLQDEYINEFGLDENYKQQLRLTKEITGLNCDFVISRDRFLLNVIKMKELDIESTKIGEAYSFYQVKDWVEKYKGFRVDPLTTSVKEWYYSLKNMSDGQAD